MRHYRRRTERGTKSVELMQRAADLVINKEKSLRSVCRDFDISKTSLTRFIARLKENPESPRFGYGTPRQVFSVQQEISLTEYLLAVAEIYHGLEPQEVRRLAYKCAVAYNVTVPGTWHSNQMAGKEWLTAFLIRNPRLSIRKPEATSLGRATSFNRTNVTEYYDKLAQVMDRYKFRGSSIWNVDETGCSTVVKPSKIVAAKGKRNVGSVTSGERGTNVTLTVAVSATGSSVPPMFVFPRKKYQNHFVRDGPPESIGAGNGSGWVTDVEFLMFMKHFISYVKPTTEAPVLLLLDNHSSHLSVETLNLAKDNGVIMLSYPPHCSHKLQPLDVSVFGPFKRYLSSAQDAWMRNNPGKTMTIYDIPGIVRKALPQALTPINISKGFQATGVYPFNREIFDDSDFAPSFVTDRPNPTKPASPTSTEIQPSDPQPPTSPSLLASDSQSAEILQYIANENQLANDSVIMSSSDPMLSSVAVVELQNHSPLLDEPQPSTSRTNNIFSPESVRPFPKAGARKVTNRKRRKTAILTDTPELNALSLEQQNKNKKKKVTRKKAVQKNKVVKRKILTENPTDSSSSSSEEECFCLVCCESFLESIPGEGWIQCSTCKGWAHDKCVTNPSLQYICNNCDSDED